ncbi:zinc/cadmium/mercury/lead-transporting ATPase [Vibrio tritonius]|uniref:P-type Zn(2+) transporter n=1 Tax=Vibrio tritonius TaxID=1435069 RepID=A0ABS7YRK0_9VIBR|nr:zinc/cadmium/mercury/lead-transporting ATPase [Vibrio tritonius]MCA2018310.1 zinc/cadmium/mercury/lead-transporting ATPase [Vibrio tritonius]
MCTKHTDCCSNRSAKPAKHQESCAHVSPKILSIRPATGSVVSGALTMDAQSLEGGGGDDEEPARRGSLYRSSWRVIGMDCPSCARKIENAVGQLSDIVAAKVVFSTEKLVVDHDHEQTIAAVEQAVGRSGFKIVSLSAPTSAETLTQPWYQQSDNLRLIGLGVGMLAAFVASFFSDAAAQWLYVLTCLAGLLPIAVSAFKLARAGTPFAIEMLMTVAAFGALYLGETAEAAMVLWLFLIGERLEGFAAEKARSGVQALMALLPEKAIKIVDGQRVETEIAQLAVGDIVEVGPGGRLPADGYLTDASASIDESALTGESIPVEHVQGDSLSAGTVVIDKVVQIKVTSRQGENAIDRILHMIEEAESRKAPLERFLEKFSGWYTPLMMVVALLVVTIPPMLFAQPWETWVYRGLAMLLIACPCALVISTPAAITSGLAMAARLGVLIKGGAALEKLAHVDHLALDKTGTLTQGKPHVTDVIGFDAWSEERILAVAAAVEVGSTHPLAQAVIQKAEHSGLIIEPAQQRSAMVGRGVSGKVDHQTVTLIAPNHYDNASNQAQALVKALQSEGKTAVYVTVNDQIAGVIAWQDTLRDDALSAIAKLKELGVESIMLTGDHQRSAAAIAGKLGITFQAQLLPENKVAGIRTLAKQHNVAMVGDGINDAPAMKEAHIGIAMGGGSDVALETADAAITHNQLIELPNMIALSRATMRNIKQNVTIALGLKAVFLVTSLLGITGLWVAVLADSGATALVTLNALRLLRYKPKFN